MSVFPLNIPDKEDHPDKTAKLEGVESKYFETAEEINKKTAAIQENRDAISAIAKGTGERYDTLAIAMATDPLPADNTPFVISAEPGANGQYYFDSTQTEGYYLVELFISKAGEDDGLEKSSKYFDGDKTSKYVQVKTSTKVGKDEGLNKLDPNDFNFREFWYKDGHPQKQVIDYDAYGSTGFIKADPLGLITEGAGTKAQGLASHVVFDNNYQRLRNVDDTNQYTYVAGDGYVKFVYNVNYNLNFAKTTAVVVGTKYMFKVYTALKKLTDLQSKVAVVEKGLNVNNISNGSELTHLVSSNFYDNLFITNRDLENDILTLYKSGSGNIWTYSDLIEATGTESVHIKFDVQFTRTGGHDKGLIVYVAVGGSPSSGFFESIGTVTNDGDVDITYDPAYYSQYHGIDSLRIWLWNEPMEAGQTMTALVQGLTAVQYRDSVEGVYINGGTSKELFESADLAVSNVYTAIGATNIKVNPLGDKYEMGVDVSGNVVARPIIPTKAAFFGNSLITGWNVTFGMASSAQDKDYYYLVTEAIKGINPTFTSIRGNQGSYEDIDETKSEASIQASIDNAFLNKLDGDEDLVCFQLGDNVNNASRVAMFGQTSLQVLQQVRTKCPNARVFWMGMWYGSSEKYEILQNSCNQTGATFISFSGLVTPENVSAIGNVSNLGTSGVRTLEGVTNFVENTPTNITVSFDYFGESYESTVDVVSYSLSSTTLTYTSDYVIIADAGIASHPGDSGMKAIANRFLYQSGISDVEEFYT